MIKTALISLLFLLARCAEPVDTQNRWEQDRKIGLLSEPEYEFTSPDGLLSVTRFNKNQLELRASAPNFTFHLQRKSASLERLEVIITNVMDSLILSTDKEVIPKSEVEGLPLAYRFEVSFPKGVNRLNVSSILPREAPFTFLAMGDIQNGIDKFDDMVTAINKEKGVDFLIFLGDLVMTSTKEEFKRAFYALDDINIPTYTVIGNHDIGGDLLYQSYLGVTNYTFSYKGVRFTNIDSASYTLYPKVWDFYKNTLKQGKDQLHILVTHIPPTEIMGYRGGHWRSRREANTFIQLAAENGVDMMLFGHLHTLDSYQLAKIPSYITGGAGAFGEELDNIGRHFLRISVNEQKELKVKVIKVDKRD